MLMAVFVYVLLLVYIEIHSGPEYQVIKVTQF